MPVDFSKLNAKPMGEVKRPPSAPASTYLGVIKGFRYGDSRFENKDTHQKDGALILDLTATECNDPQVEMPPGYTLRGKVFPTEYTILDANQNSLPGQYYVKVLMESLGIPTEGKSFSACVSELVGAQVMFDLTVSGDDGQYNNVRKLRAKQS